MANYLVTGGGGFIGSNLVRALLDAGHAVRVLDDFSSGKRENLSEIQDRIDLIEGDIRDLATCQSSCADMEVVLHQAALGSVPRSVEDPITSNDVNIGGTLSMLWAAKGAKVRRFVFAASSAAYGESAAMPKQEDMPTAPISPYGVAKLTCEHYCRVFCLAYGLETFALRYFNVFGPYQDPTSQYAAVIPLFVSAMLHKKQPVVFGDGEQTRDFTYIDNVVQANILAAQAKEARGEVINIACQKQISLNQILDLLRELLDTDIGANYTDPRAGDIKHSLADISRAREILSFEPAVDFKQGLRLAIDWYKNNL
ncbi:MAG: SDR family oxidoreductase [Gammaproteobacteria bacterium]|nr:SDR family oxidoreductase [Gammaproteobacteria bacterium]